MTGNLNSEESCPSLNEGNYSDRLESIKAYSYSKLAAAVLNQAFADAQRSNQVRNKSISQKIERNRKRAKAFLEEKESKEWKDTLIALASFWFTKDHPDGRMMYTDCIDLRKVPTITV